MMDTGQRVAFVKRRALERGRSWERHTIQRLSLLSGALFCCLIDSVRRFSDGSPGAVQGLSGATMLLDHAGGYVLVGVLAFAAAAVVTVLCLRLREKSTKRDEPIKEDKKI